MTRDEMIDEMAKVLSPEELAQAICHDAFDGFVSRFAHDKDRIAKLICVAWTGFRQGWDGDHDKR